MLTRTVLSHPDKLNLLQRAKDKGYFIRDYFIYDNTETTFRLCRKHKSSITLYESELWPYEEVNKLIFSREVPQG